MVGKKEESRRGVWHVPSQRKKKKKKKEHEDTYYVQHGRCQAQGSCHSAQTLLPAGHPVNSEVDHSMTAREFPDLPAVSAMMVAVTETDLYDEESGRCQCRHSICTRHSCLQS